MRIGRDMAFGVLLLVGAWRFRCVCVWGGGGGLGDVTLHGRVVFPAARWVSSLSSGPGLARSKHPTSIVSPVAS